MPKDTLPAPGLRLAIGQYSAAGPKPENQDFHGATVPEGRDLALKGAVIALADGISSSRHGRAAAETAVAGLMTDYFATPETWTVETAARRVIAATNAWLHAQGPADDPDRGHVATLSALILKGREAHVLHLGDARVVRVAGRSLEPLTRDHRSPAPGGGHTLDRALGAAAVAEVEYTRVPVDRGDVFVLMTDGVHEALAVSEIAELATGDQPEGAARRLVEAALAAGSTDNATALVVRIDALPMARDWLEGEAADLPLPPLPRPGDRLDGFRILRQVHASARSHVFLATDDTGRKVALKIPASDSAADPVYCRRFLLEDWIARRVSSPHILAPGPQAERSALYVTSEWLEGRSLRQWLTDHPRPEREKVRDIAGQIVAGLRALHRRQMIHQDLRPENVMIDDQGTVKIIDLGSVAVAGVEEVAPGLLGQMPGTLQYTAPEYLSGDVASWRSDQYALGVMVYEMLTGRLPYGPQVARIRSRADQRRLRYRPARDDETGVPGWIDWALARACHPDPLRRYDSLSEFLADLRRPAAAWEARRHVPLAERNPVRFWQAVSALLAVALLVALGRGY